MNYFLEMFLYVGAFLIFMGLLDMLKRRRSKEPEHVIVSRPDEDDAEPTLADIIVPDELKEDGFYALEFEEGGIYGEYGRDIGFFTFCMLYDRREGILVDVTLNVKGPYRNVCKVQPFEVGSEDKVRNIEAFLTGERKPMYIDDSTPQGIRFWKVTELGPEYDGLRQSLVGLRDASKALDAAKLEVQKSEEAIKAIYG